MIIKAKNISEKEIILPSPVSLVLNQEEDVPADSLNIVIPFDNKITEIISVELIGNNGETVFKGITDEQITVFNSQGRYIKISARSMAALLLDNETFPITYNKPNPKVIFDNHVKEFGIIANDLESVTFYGNMAASKGESCWQVLNNFCQNLYGKQPRISSDGILFMQGITNTKKIIFSNTVQGTPYSSITHNIKRCNEISHICAKTQSWGGYTTIVKNNNALDRKINRRRMLNATMDKLTPLICADQMIDKSRKNGFSINIVCPYELSNVLGAKAQIYDECLGEIQNLYISKVKYTLSSKLQQTVLTLKKIKN